jgi:hypothetical protein
VSRSLSARALAFGDLETSAWGIAWAPEGSPHTLMAAGVRTGRALLPGELASDGATWSLDGAEASVAWEAIGPEMHGGADLDGIVSDDHLCQVRGALVVEGERIEVSCLGWQTSVSARVEPERLESFRLVAAWFEPGDGLSLIALRPRKARGQEADLVAASVLDAGHAPRVTDPRLSTTYSAGGLPARAGLELWLEDENAQDAEGVAAYPRRAAGEAERGAIDWTVDGFALRAELLRWHSHGRDGPGIYLLGERR